MFAISNEKELVVVTGIQEGTEKEFQLFPFLPVRATEFKKAEDGDFHEIVTEQAYNLGGLLSVCTVHKRFVNVKNACSLYSL